MQGATIRRDERTGEIYVARVIHGGLADRSGENISISYRTYSQVAQASVCPMSQIPNIGTGELFFLHSLVYS